MNRELRLKLTFEGTGDGLDKGRLSIDSFALALYELQRAFRRIAQGFVTAAANPGPEYVDAPSGRLSLSVARLSLQIDAISHNSPPQVDLVCPLPDVVVGASWPMFMEQTIDRTADELLSAIEAEAKGQPRNAAVRAYLAKLPTGVVRQSFDLVRLDGVRREVSLGPIERVQLDQDFPFFAIQTAHVGGVAFNPLPPEVRFSGDGLATHASADEQQVEQALAHRGRPMTGLFVRKGKSVRAIWLEPGSEQLKSPTNEELDAHFAKRWASTLRLLAE
jgi:hypothetical protein